MTYQPRNRPRSADWVNAIAWFRALPEPERLRVIRTAGRSTACIVKHYSKGNR